MFKMTTALVKIAKMKSRISAVQGGTGAGKTYAIIANEINYCCHIPNLSVSVVSMSFPHLKRGAIRDFLHIMKTTNRFIEANWNRTNSIYTFVNSSYIEFFSADNGDKMRGPRRNRLYLNEANNLTFEAYNTLAVRTNDKITLDWNPTNKFWFHKQLEGDKDVEFVKMTYRDNEACPQSAIDFIEKAREKAKASAYWENWYRVYGLGEVGVLQDVIFPDVEVIGDVPDEAELLGYGMDFGYTNDPTTLIAAYRYNDKIVWDEVLYYRNEVLNDSYYSDLLLRMSRSGVNKEVMIYADKAKPDSIMEISSNGGFLIRGADKGAGSILHGIGLLHEYTPIVITSRSENIKKELENYAWDKDKEGNGLNKPIDRFNHAIDAMRYFAVMRLSRGGSGRSQITGVTIIHHRDD